MADRPRDIHHFAGQLVYDLSDICEARDPRTEAQKYIKEWRQEMVTKVAASPELAELDAKLKNLEIQTQILDLPSIKKGLDPVYYYQTDELWSELSAKLQVRGFQFNTASVTAAIKEQEYYQNAVISARKGNFDLNTFDVLIDMVVTKNIMEMKDTPPLEQIVTAKTTSDLSNDVKARADRVIRDAREVNSSPLKPHQLQAQEKELELA